MDSGAIEPAIDWLLANRSGNGWPSEIGRGPSLTVTSEVVLALLAAQPILNSESSVITPSLELVLAEAVAFIQQQMVDRADFDLPNVAYSIHAVAVSHAPTTVEFVERSIALLEQFAPNQGDGWRATPASAGSDTFSTCLIALALHAVLRTANDSPFANVLSHAQNQLLTRWYEQTTTYVFAQAPRGNDGGWRDSGSVTATSQPAITALVLYLRHTYLSAIGMKPASVQRDAVCLDAVRYLSSQRLDEDNLVYSLARGNYSVFFLPYIILALQGILEYLPGDQVSYFYLAAQQLAGKALRQEEADGNLGAWYPSLSRRTDYPSVWATAHALRGLVAIRVDETGLRYIAEAITERDELRNALDAAEVPAGLDDESAIVGDTDPALAKLIVHRRKYAGDLTVLLWGRLQFAISTWLFLAFTCGIATACTVDLFVRPILHALRWVLLGVIFIALTAAAYCGVTAASGQRPIWSRLLQAIIAACTISALLFYLIDTYGAHTGKI